MTLYFTVWWSDVLRRHYSLNIVVRQNGDIILSKQGCQGQNSDITLHCVSNTELPETMAPLHDLAGLPEIKGYQYTI